MHTLIIKGQDLFDESTGRFIEAESTRIDIEHSLVSLSKWESIWLKPFLSETSLTPEESQSYIECMLLNPSDAQHLSKLTPKDYVEAFDYINAKATATWFRETPTNPYAAKHVITSEIIYHWIVALEIPITTEHWHLNRLITLIRVCNEKNREATNKKKTSRTGDMASRRSALNAQRRAAQNSSG